jgi:hypothetical protein
MEGASNFKPQASEKRQGSKPQPQAASLFFRGSASPREISPDGWVRIGFEIGFSEAWGLKFEVSLRLEV